MAFCTGPMPPNKCPVPKRLKRSHFWPNLSDTSRQKENREKTPQTRPVASQYASTAMLHTPINHQRLQENMPLWIFLVLISNLGLECFAILVTKLQPRIKIKSHNKWKKQKKKKNKKQMKSTKKINKYPQPDLNQGCLDWKAGALTTTLTVLVDRDNYIYP